jgi:hypothetical protein
MNRGPLWLILTIAFLATLGGCAQLGAQINNTVRNPPAGRIVAISLFKCNCEPLVRETVQDTFIDEFFHYTNSKPVKGENGDITIVGIITMDQGQTGSSKGSVFGGGYSGSAAVGGSSSGSSASGTYVTGITVQAFKNGELIATHSEGQNLGKGTLISLVTIAKNAAHRISSDLVSRSEVGRK